MGSTEELCPGCSGQCPSCGRDIQGAELSEIRQALEASRAETREARRLLVRWFYGKPPKHGEHPLIDDVAAFLAGRGGSPAERADPQWCADCEHPREFHYEDGLCQAAPPPGCPCEGWRAPLSTEGEPSTGGEKPGGSHG